ncbi:MAG: hypothetical protein MZV64_11570 [Ignavibacteriales bacterium]|nr:hypothetical protein [Ignavibacteriales bacterium]
MKKMKARARGCFFSIGPPFAAMLLKTEDGVKLIDLAGGVFLQHVIMRESGGASRLGPLIGAQVFRVLLESDPDTRHGLGVLPEPACSAPRKK